MTLSVQITQPPLETSGLTKCFFVVKIRHRYHWKQNNCKRPTYYTMITLFDKNRKYYNQNNKIFHLFSHMVLQAAPLIGTTKPSNSAPGASDRHAQLLKVGNFEIIWNLNEILVRVMRYNPGNICWSSRRLEDVFKVCLEDIFNTSSA